MFQNTELNSSKIDRYSLIEQSENCSNYKKALKCIALKYAQNLPKILPGISLKFHILCFPVFLLCLHYALKLPAILSIDMENLSNDCSIRVFHCRQGDCFIREYLSKEVFAMHLSAFFCS